MPSGRRRRPAVFDSQHAGQRHLFRLHLDDGSIEQLTSGPSEAQGSVSVLPDGRLVHESWSCTTGLYLGIHVTSADGTQTSAITDPQDSATSGDDEQPDGSPDGRSVAFVRQVGDGTGAIFVVPVDGGTATRLTKDIADIARPQWSPDGRTILFEVSGQLWTVPSTGGDPQQIPRCPAYCWQGDWSPDGTRIIFKNWVYGDGPRRCVDRRRGRLEPAGPVGGRPFLGGAARLGRVGRSSRPRVTREVAEARVAAALAAGGRLVRDDRAPAWWTLADAAGNEIDIATTHSRD